ncbi:Transient receptor potential cation channel subfamily M member 6 [Paramuricea clavata]|uniref:Transient receptor potential cation channel subfamily M member 6 n=1 Tax=Paramuricea clavata TaxID=317549 RepID=A0A7D9DGI3_PARCT|nr:Transient receptor potential cation channel subfamily M member 6 [Paramuricea clavata]
MHLSSGLKGRFVLKKYKEDQVQSIIANFGSLEIHTRKVVQIPTLARHFMKCLSNEIPPDFGALFLYNKLYYGKLDEQCITIEQYLDGDFRKYINNTGEIIVSDGSDLSEMFSHYTYIKLGKRLMVLYIQGAGYSLCDPEIASAEFTDTDDNIFFCNGNLSHGAIYSFVSHHVW